MDPFQLHVLKEIIISIPNGGITMSLLKEKGVMISWKCVAKMANLYNKLFLESESQNVLG